MTRYTRNSCLDAWHTTRKQTFQGSSSGGTVLKTTSTAWYTQYFREGNYGSASASFPIQETTSWPNGQTKQIQTDYDCFQFNPNGTCAASLGQVIATREYDYGMGAPGPLLRTTNTTYAWQSPSPNSSTYLGNNLLDLISSVQVLDGGGTQRAYTSYGYDESSLQSSGITEQKVAGLSLPGNQTSVHHWLNGSTIATVNCPVSVSNGYLVSNNIFFDTGEVQKTTDPCGYATSFQYSSTYFGAFPTTVTNALNQNTTYAYDSNTGAVTSVTDANSQPTSTAYDILARPTQVSYPDGGSTKYCYTDMGGVGCTQSGPPYSVVTTTAITPSPVLNKVSTAVFDGLGRPSQTQLNSDAPSATYTQITYDALGRKSKVYNPTRCNPPTTNCGETTWGFSTTNYDALNRVTSVTEQDGSAPGTDYSAFPCITVTDETGKSRKSCVNGLGQMTQVFEDPGSSPHLNYETDYQYDALGNLICSVQKGTDTTAFTSCSAVPSTWRPRSFTYDSLSRLTIATNPESGTITYGYDANGNLASKVAASPNQPSTGSAHVTTSYTYDALNRLVSKGFSDNYLSNPPTMPAIFGYDGIAITGCPAQTPPGDPDTYPKGRRTSMCDGSGASNWTHDQMGRIKQERRTIGSVAGENDTDVYNLDGSVASIGSLGFQVAYTFNGAGRPLSALGPNTYVQSNGATYAPFGGLSSAKLGLQPITITNAYNNRLQPVLISATAASSIMSLCYDFHSKTTISSSPCTFPASTTGDNGNVFQIVNNRDSNRTQNFLYDSLNRISQAYTSGPNWGETFGPTATNPGVQPTSPGIDAWGNLTNRSGVVGKTLHEGLSCAANVNNRLGSCSLGFDAAGNTILNGSTAYTYDAENRLIATAGISYIYDGDGKRVEKCTAGTTLGTCATGATGTLYWGVAGGETSTETDLAGNILEQYVYFNGKRIARREPTSPAVVHFYFSDHLGTHSLVTDAIGTMPPQEESDFYPYGGEIPVSGSDTNHYKFTGKEHDSESGLDNFGARYDASSLGRFMTPDWAARPTAVPYSKFEDPQTLNLYGYVRNNPLWRADIDGHSWWDKIKNFLGDAGCWCEGKQAEAAAAKTRAEREKARREFAKAANSPVGRRFMIFYAMYGGMYGAVFSFEEQAIADELVGQGYEVEPIEPVQGQKNPDANVTAPGATEAVKTEFKTVTVAGENTLKNQIQDGLKQAPNVVVDVRGTSITRAEAMQQIQRVEGNMGSVQGRVMVITNEGTLKH
jgi:RHS repeat-associated protein